MVIKTSIVKSSMVNKEWGIQTSMLMENERDIQIQEATVKKKLNNMFSKLTNDTSGISQRTDYTTSSLH